MVSYFNSLIPFNVNFLTDDKLVLFYQKSNVSEYSLSI